MKHINSTLQQLNHGCSTLQFVTLICSFCSVAVRADSSPECIQGWRLQPGLDSYKCRVGESPRSPSTLTGPWMTAFASWKQTQMRVTFQTRLPNTRTTSTLCRKPSIRLRAQSMEESLHFIELKAAGTRILSVSTQSAAVGRKVSMLTSVGTAKLSALPICS